MALIATIALSPNHEKGAGTDCPLRMFSFRARLHLIERIIDERVVASNVHKRVLATKRHVDT